MATIEDMEELVFGCCGAVAWLPKTLLKDRRESGQNFYCPNGHVRCYRKTTAEKLKDELEATKMALSQKMGALEGIKSGKCPFCWKIRKNLSEHIERNHQ